MKTRLLALLLGLLAFSWQAPGCDGWNRGGQAPTIPGCSRIVANMAATRPELPPDLPLGRKPPTEEAFDVGRYFEVLTHLSMQEGHTLRWVYREDDLGGSPVLYALPAGKEPFASLAEVPAGVELPSPFEHLRADGTERSFFELVVFRIMAGQFFLVWHAAYNDAQIVCDADAAQAIVEGINAEGFCTKLSAAQQAQVRAVSAVEPQVRLTAGSAIVEVVVFSKWGGFSRHTYTILRSFPHRIEVQRESLVRYRCGIIF